MNKRFIESIQTAYPELPIEDSFLNENGQNNDVLIVNKALVFRFPKYDNGVLQLKKEKDILTYIQELVTIPIPDPIYHSLDKFEPGKVFSGYKMLKGVPLWKESLAGVESVELLQGLAIQLVSFLKELHSISGETAKQELNLHFRHPCDEMEELYSDIQTKLFPYIRKDLQLEITQSFQTLKSEAFANLETTLIHGDFGASNILWIPETCKISGIIDFGGSGIGDPAYDFAGILSCYGEDFFEMCIDLYPNGSEIAERVRFYKSTFALQEALHGIENNDHNAFENGIKDYR